MPDESTDTVSSAQIEERANNVGAVSEQDIRFINPKELRTNLAFVLDEVLRGCEYTIRRRKSEVARLTPYHPAPDTSPETDVVSTTELNRKLGSLIDRARSGVRLIIKRSGNRVAELRPPLPAPALEEEVIRKVEETIAII